MHFFTAFPDDWLGGTAGLTTEESGAHWNLICFYMSKDGNVPDNERILSRVVKLSIRRWRRVKQTLIDGGFIEVRDGLIWQAKCEERLEKDGNFATSQREKVKKRWAKKRAKSLKTNGSADTPVDTAAYTTPNLTSLSKDKGADEAPGSVDPARIIFGKNPGGCLHFLLAHDVKEQSSRGLLGKWRKQHGDGAIIEVIAEAGRQSVSEPVAWIEKTLRVRGRRATGGRPADDGWL